MTDLAAIVGEAVRRELGFTQRRPFILGICGAQGSGKSTLAATLEQDFNRSGTGCVTLSLDDLYKTRAARRQMAAEVHPLFETRGAPGTHDLDLAFDLLHALEHGGSGRFPRFDKSRDDRAPREGWGIAPMDTQVLIFEGWFVGARPQEGAALIEPVNALEREEDPDGIWRGSANAALASEYSRLFARIDLLVLLAAPAFDVVRSWRAEQERHLRIQKGGGMDEAQIGRFVEHYERLTRHVLVGMPAYADIVIRLDHERRPLSVSARSRSGG